MNKYDNSSTDNVLLSREIIGSNSAPSSDVAAWLRFMGMGPEDADGRFFTYHHAVITAVFMPEEFFKWKTLRRLTK